jgi:enamine deaminase RidA (YjgF/YER057c/UK114 family)
MRRTGLFVITLIMFASVCFSQTQRSYEARLKELKIELPPAPKPIAAYVPAVQTGDLIFLAGQGPIREGKVTITGKVGSDLSEEQGYKAARETVLVSLAALKAEIGSLDRVKRIVKLTGFVNSAPGFTRQPWVINGASELLVEVFGEAGKHARSAVGTSDLPLNIPVEIELIVEVYPGAPMKNTAEKGGRIILQ